MSDASIQRFEHRGLVHVVRDAMWMHRPGRLKQLWITVACEDRQRRYTECDQVRVLSARTAPTCLWCVEASVR